MARYAPLSNIEMEELLGALGISGPALGAVIWYVKTRIVKNEKKLEKIQ